MGSNKTVFDVLTVALHVKKWHVTLNGSYIVTCNFYFEHLLLKVLIGRLPALLCLSRGPGFRSQSRDFVNAPQCYVMHTLPVLSRLYNVAAIL